MHALALVGQAVAQAVFDRLRQRTLDLGFVYRAPEPESDLSSAVVLDEPLMLAMPKDDPLRKSRLIKPSFCTGR